MEPLTRLLVASQLMFLVRTFMCPPAERWEIARFSAEQDVGMAAMRLGEFADGFARAIVGQIITQVRTYSIGIRVDGSIRQNLPGLRQQQDAEIHSQLAENERALAPEIRQKFPKPLVDQHGDERAARHPLGRCAGGATYQLIVTRLPPPVDITASGALAGRSVTAIAAGGAHSLALASDGTLTAWGHNHRRQLGVTDTTQRTLPAVVNLTAPPLAITAGSAHNLALFAAGGITGCGRPLERPNRPGHPENHC